MESKSPKPETKITETPVTTNDTLTGQKVETVGGNLTAAKKPGEISVQNLKEQPWKEWVDKAAAILAEIPDYIGSFFSGYQRPLITLLLILAGIVTVRIILAVLGAIDNIPLLAPLLELIGLGYAAWFVYRYLWKAENRQELIQEFRAFKSQIVGQDSSEI